MTRIGRIHADFKNNVFICVIRVLFISKKKARTVEMSGPGVCVKAGLLMWQADTARSWVSRRLRVGTLQSPGEQWQCERLCSCFWIPSYR